MDIGRAEGMVGRACVQKEMKEKGENGSIIQKGDKCIRGGTAT
jgi:hypothetical protein